MGQQPPVLHGSRRGTGEQGEVAVPLLMSHCPGEVKGGLAPHGGSGKATGQGKGVRCQLPVSSVAQGLHFGLAPWVWVLGMHVHEAGSLEDRAAVCIAVAVSTPRDN